MKGTAAHEGPSGPARRRSIRSVPKSFRESEKTRPRRFNKRRVDEWLLRQRPLIETRRYNAPHKHVRFKRLIYCRERDEQRNANKKKMPAIAMAAFGRRRTGASSGVATSTAPSRPADAESRATAAIPDTSGNGIPYIERERDALIGCQSNIQRGCLGSTATINFPSETLRPRTTNKNSAKAFENIQACRINCSELFPHAADYSSDCQVGGDNSFPVTSSASEYLASVE